MYKDMIRIYVILHNMIYLPLRVVTTDAVKMINTALLAINYTLLIIIK